MLKVYRRAADEAHLKTMTGPGGSLGRNLVTATLPACIVVSLIVYLVWKSMLVAAVLGAGLFVAAVISNVRFFRSVARRRALQADPNAVEVMEVFASRVLAIEPLDDDAPAFCCFIDSGKAVLLVGQWLLEYKSFPATSFRIHLWSDTKKPIRLEIMGPPIEAQHSAVQLKPSYRYSRVELLNATPETLQEDLDRSLGRRSVR